MALRSGFVRYAFSIQYHGSSFLGFAHLRHHENSVLPDGTDLRGYYSIEGRLRLAFDSMVGVDHYENIKVSSRTDRGVHALKNTCHVDIQLRPTYNNNNSKRTIPSNNDNNDNNHNENTKMWDPDVLRRGLNYYLSQQGADIILQAKVNTNNSSTSSNERLLQRRARRKLDHWSFHYPMNELRILNMIQAPLWMNNDYHKIDPTQPPQVDWNVRFSATQRTYMYRILACHNETGGDWALPFEWDRSWRVLPTKVLDNHTNSIKHNDTHQDGPCRGLLNVTAMRKAAESLVGTHDFSSFRSAGCARSSPIVTIHDIQIASQFYGEPSLWGMPGGGGLLGLGDNNNNNNNNNDNNNNNNNNLPQLVIVKVVGKSFLYHQVRNMVGALCAVGRGTLDPNDMKAILEAKDRTMAPPMAPAHGLFLVDVKHDDIEL